jgi:septal ring factor EnvC (AmiA/AmiB activator)
MATQAELIEEREALAAQLTAVNAQILAVIQQKNKKYTYSNQETTHSAEMQSLAELREMKSAIKEQIADIDAKLGRGLFVQIKNC